MEKTKILFVSMHNSLRSQMAEAFLNEMAAEYFVAASAGLDPGKLSPLAVSAMAYIGIDISDKNSKSIPEVCGTGKCFDYVVTLCDNTESCKFPEFPAGCKKQNWEIPETSVYKGSYSYRLERTRHVRNMIERKVKGLVKDVMDCNTSAVRECTVSEEPVRYEQWSGHVSLKVYHFLVKSKRF